MGVTAEEFLIKMQEQVSGPSSRAEAALLRLEAQIRREQAALTGLEGKLASAKTKLAEIQDGAGGKVSIDAVNKQRSVVKGIEEAIAASKSGLDKLGGARGELAGILDPEKLIGKKGAIKDVLGGELGNLASAAQAAGGPLGGLAGQAQNLAAIAGKGGAAGVVLALAAAVYALGKAIVSTILDFARFVAMTADAARSARLLNDAAAGSAKGGAELSAVVQDIAGKVPLAKDRIAEMGRQLEIAHLSGRRMQNALEAMGITASAVGDSAAQKLGQIAEQAQKIRRFMVGRYDLEGTGLAFDELAAQVAESSRVTVAQARVMLQRGQLSVDQGLEAMAAAVQKKFGGTVAAQMLSLKVQMDKLHENIAAIFGGANLEPFLKGLKLITDLFSQNTVTGRILKTMFETLFNPLVKQGSTVFPVIRGFLQGLIIGLLLVEIAFLKVKKVMSEAFGGSKSDINWVNVAIAAGATIVIGMTLALAALAAGATAAGIALLFAFLPVIATMALVAAGIYLVVKAVRGAAAAVGSVDLGAAATNIVNSFVNGIKANIGSVVSSMAGLGSAAAAALKGALGIASPSKVAIDAARNVTTTFAGEVEDGQGDTQAAFAGMVDPKSLAGTRGGAKSGNTYGPFYVEYKGNSREEADDFMAKFKRMLQELNGEGPIGAT